MAGNFRMDWAMLWKEITIGFLLAGFIGLLGNEFFNGLFVKDAPAGLRTIENVIAVSLLEDLWDRPEIKPLLGPAMAQQYSKYVS